MTPENFCYWLTGFVELTRGQTPDPAQWKAIREHLDLVFNKVTPEVAPSLTPTMPSPTIAPVIPVTYPNWWDTSKVICAVGQASATSEPGIITC
ncbi:MAG TPA: hypothetical protein VF783_14065 [Terriglobales bacterium]